MSHDSSDEEAEPLSASSELQITAVSDGNERDVKQLIANGVLQNGRIANTHVYYHPRYLGFVLATTAALLWISGIWTRRDYGIAAMLLPCLGCCALLLVEYSTYPIFEAEARNVKKQLDSHESLARRYHGSNMMWVAIYENQVVGVIAIECDNGVALVTHWYVLNRLQNRGLGSDLLDIAIEYARAMRASVMQINTWSLQQRAETTLSQKGFAFHHKGESGGLGWLKLVNIERGRLWLLKL